MCYNKKKNKRSGVDVLSRHHRWLNLALRKAVSSHKLPDYWHSAIIVEGGRVLSIGLNRDKLGCLFDPVYQLSEDYSQGFHAEVDAMYRLLKKFPDFSFKNTILYVAGLHRNGGVLNSKPCPRCQQMIAKYGFKNVYYCDRGEIGIL